jgi:glycerate dehydrogenase
MMERIVYLDRSILRTGVRRQAFEHEWIEYATSRPEAVKARLEGATSAITHRSKWARLGTEKPGKHGRIVDFRL